VTSKDLKALRALDQEIDLALSRLEHWKDRETALPEPFSSALAQKRSRERELFRYIQRIPDDEVRLIFSYRYLEGLSWAQIARRMGYQDESAPRKRHARYLRGLKKRGRHFETARTAL